MDVFYTQFDRTLRAAFHYGINSVHLRSDPERPFEDINHYKRFTAACHRGFEKAQRSVLEMLKENAMNYSLAAYERRRRELLLRKVIDGIIFTMLKQMTYVTRRISLHDNPPNLDFAVIDKAKFVADRLNREDRLTFCALADLSTFVHICDLVHIDRRAGKDDFSFIELKEGRVNKIIAAQIEQYTPVPESLDQIKHDNEIAPGHRNQAKRMQKQRIRFQQTADVLRDDVGVDIKSGKPIRMNHTLINEVHYYKDFNASGEVALAKGIAAFTVNYCLHIGMGSGPDLRECVRRARLGALTGQFEVRNGADGDLKSFYERNERPGGLGPDAYRMINVVKSHLLAIPVNSLFCWSVSQDVIDAIVRDRLAVFCIFDLPAFMFVIRSAGLVPSLTSRAEAMKVAALGMGAAPTRNPAGRAGLCPPNQATAVTDLPFRTRTFPERIPSSFAVPVFSDFRVDVRTLAQKR